MIFERKGEYSSEDVSVTVKGETFDVDAIRIEPQIEFISTGAVSGITVCELEGAKGFPFWRFDMQSMDPVRFDMDVEIHDGQEIRLVNTAIESLPTHAPNMDKVDLNCVSDWPIEQPE